MQTSCINELINMAREAGCEVTTYPPSDVLPTAIAEFGLRFDPQHLALLRVTDGCVMHSKGIDLSIYGASGRSSVMETHASLRESRDDIVFLSEIVPVAHLDSLSWELVTVPRLANAQGVQPVCFFDYHEEGYLEPVASSLNRALMMFLAHAIRTKDDYRDIPVEELFPKGVPSLDTDAGLAKFLLGMARCLPESEPFPTGVIDEIAADKELMDLVHAGAFDTLDGGTDACREWLQSLREAEPLS